MSQDVVRLVMLIQVLEAQGAWGLAESMRKILDGILADEKAGSTATAMFNRGES